MECTANDICEMHTVMKDEFEKNNVEFNICSNIVSYKVHYNTINIKYSTIGQKSNISQLNKNYINDHFFRIIDSKLDDLDTYEAINVLLEYLSNIYKYCTVCAKKISIPLNKICSCSHNDKCKYIMESMLIDDTVTNAFNRDQNTFFLLVKSSLAVCKVPDRFNPYPYYFKNENEYHRNVLKDGANNKFFDMDKINAVLNKIDKIDLDKIMNTVNNDKELYDATDEDIYALLKFIIKSNRASISSDKYTEYTDKCSMTYTQNDNFEFYSLKYHAIVESEFTKNNSILLYHGSSYYNWHPIMRIGIKNLSGTKLMANGAAYGNGVYLSPNVHIACGYCRSSTMILGVCAVKNHEKYKKNDNVYVVSDDSDLLLKYLVYIKKNNCNDYKIIDSYFSKREENINNIIKLSKIVSKRLNKEKNTLSKNGYNVNVVNYDLWNINIAENDVRIYFPPSYPMEPPIFYFNKVQIKSDYVMNKGIIFTSAITPCDWIPNTRILNIIDDIAEKIILSHSDKFNKVEWPSLNEIVKEYHYLTYSLDLFNT